MRAWAGTTLGRFLRRVVPGVHRVHAQVTPYATRWDAANELILTTTGPLWVVLGDSTAQGIGAPGYDQGYVGQLRILLDEQRGENGPWRVLNLSRSGARSADALESQLPRLESLPVEPDLVTCAIGANDLLPTPLDQIVARLREIMSRLPPGAVIATMPQGLRPQRAVAVNEVIKAEAPGAGLRVADVWARTGPPWRGKFASDGFHPGALGYADWTAAFAEALGLGLKTED
ncbi:MAG: GDSL-type esterase/lipase family protein [Acidimicrobiales bacterium]